MTLQQELRETAVALVTTLQDEAGEAMAARIVADVYDKHDARGLAALVMAMRDVSSLALDVATLAGTTRAEVTQEIAMAIAGLTEGR